MRGFKSVNMMIKELEELKRLERSGYTLREQWDRISSCPRFLQKLGGDPRNIIRFDWTWKKKLEHLFSFDEMEVLNYLQRKANWISPTEIGRDIGGYTRRGKRRTSAWASPICRQLVDKNLAERNSHGHYRLKQHIGQTPLEYRRGFELKDFFGPLEVCLLEAEPYLVSLVLSRLMAEEGKWTSLQKLPFPHILKPTSGYLLQKYKGHSWTFFLTANRSAHFVQKLSKELMTDGFYWHYSPPLQENFGYAFFKQGELQERYLCSSSLTTRFKEPDDPNKKSEIAVSKNQYNYSFWSQMRLVTEFDLLNEYRFLNVAFRFYEAYVPDIRRFPYYCDASGKYFPRGDSIIQPMEENSDIFSAIYLIQETAPISLMKKK